ncbi:MAG: WGR domain-containing protein [Janthinobacterium lividum]
MSAGRAAFSAATSSRSRVTSASRATSLITPSIQNNTGTLLPQSALRFQSVTDGSCAMPSPSTPAPYTLIDGRLELLAVDHTRNIARRYALEVSEDLFGFHVVETAWGRVGGSTTAKRVSFPTFAEADRLVSYHLRRRASAVRRIGVAYRPVGPS